MHPNSDSGVRAPSRDSRKIGDIFGLPPMPFRLLVACSVIGGIAGMAFGFVRGLSYLPTLPVAILEGGIIAGVPASVLGLLLMGAWSLGSFTRRLRTGALLASARRRQAQQ